MSRSAHVLVAAAVVASVGMALPASAAIPAKYSNCTNFSKYYPHGVGRVGATDHVAAGSRPVTTWKRDTNAFNTAMHYNRGLDRDHDNIACERR